MTLKEFDFTVKYIKGSDNVVADCLSRNDSLKLMESESNYDMEMYQIFEYLKFLSFPEGMETRDRKRLLNKANKFFIQDGELYRRHTKKGPRRVIMNNVERKTLLEYAHDSLGHFGIRSTYEFLDVEYFWPRMYEDVKSYVSNCETCKKFNFRKEIISKAEVGVERLFERTGIDFDGPLPETKNGFKYIIVASEYLTGWPMAKAVRRADADSTAKFIYEELICNFGCPKIIQTDRGTHFNNDLIERLSHLLEFKHSLSSPYNPQTNGKVERLNGIICKSLAKLAYENQSDWSKFLNQVLFAYRIRKNTATGLSPYELLYGTSPKLTKWLEEDLGKLVIEDREHELMNLSKKRYLAERKHVPMESQYGLGEVILLKSLSSNKMEPKWNGPYTIAVVGPNNSYQLATASNRIIPTWINGRRIQRYSIF